MSTRAQQKCKYWPTPKAIAALDRTTEAALFERTILHEGLRQMRSWTPEEVLEILEDAATILVTLRAQHVCVQCDRVITGEPVRDPETAAWLGAGAPTFCSTDCRAAYDEARMNRDEAWA